MTQRDPLKTLIIAEAGVNHNGDINLAHQLIDVAASAGADSVKFQTFTADKLVTTHAKKADYQNKTTGDVDSQHAMIRKLELNRETHKKLIKHCEEKKIQFLSTGFDIDSIDLLVDIGLERFKIPSGENNPSTLFATCREIEKTFNLIYRNGHPG